MYGITVFCRFIAFSRLTLSISPALNKFIALCHGLEDCFGMILEKIKRYCPKIKIVTWEGKVKSHFNSLSHGISFSTIFCRIKINYQYTWTIGETVRYQLLILVTTIGQTSLKDLNHRFHVLKIQHHPGPDFTENGESVGLLCDVASMKTQLAINRVQVCKNTQLVVFQNEPGFETRIRTQV